MTTPPTPQAVGHVTSTPAGPSGAVLANGRLTIHHLVSTDPDVLAGARRAGERNRSHDVTAFATSALQVGAKALAVADTSLDLADLDRSVQALTGQVTETTNAALAQLTAAVAAATDTTTGTIPTAVQAALDRLTGQVTDLVAGTDAPVRATVADAVRGVTDQVLAEVQRADRRPVRGPTHRRRRRRSRLPAAAAARRPRRRTQRVPPPAGRTAHRAAHRPRSRQSHHPGHRRRGRQGPRPRARTTRPRR